MVQAPRTYAKARARTRDELSRAGAELILRKGFEAVRIEEIAEAAGVTRGTLYNHFKSKVELLKERVRVLSDAEDWAPLRARLLAEPDVAEQMFLSLVGLFDFCGRHRPLLRIYFKARIQESVAGDFDDRSDNLQRLIEPILAAGQKRGVVRNDLSAADLAGMFRFFFLRIVSAWTRGRGPDGARDPEPKAFRRHVRTTIDLFLKGAQNGR